MPLKTAVWEVYKLMNGKFCGEAWDAISRYVYTALQGGSIMHKWTNDDRMMIACCNDGTRPVIFKIERIDIPENEEEGQWLAKQNFKIRQRMRIRVERFGFVRAMHGAGGFYAEGRNCQKVFSGVACSRH